MDGLYDSVYLSYSEFILLAGSAGISKVEVLTQDVSEVLDDASIAEAMASLFARGLLVACTLKGETVYEPVPLIKELFRDIKRSDRIRTVLSDDGTNPVMICYMGENTVVCRPDRVHPELMRFSRISGELSEDWIEWAASHKDEEEEG